MDIVKPGRGRILKFVCVRDADIREVLDLGQVRDGTPTGQRQAILRMLGKVTVIGGKRFATFRLAEAPKEIFSPEDQLDNQWLLINGSWQTPTSEWYAMRATMIEIEKAKLEESQRTLMQQAGNTLAAQMSDIVANASKAEATRRDMTRKAQHDKA